jgi:hypothetical protein
VGVRVGVLVGSGVGVSVLVGVSVGLGVMVGVAVGTRPQADNITERDASKYTRFFIDLILLKDIRRYNTAIVPVNWGVRLRLKRY